MDAKKLELYWPEIEYKSILKNILNEGVEKKNRTAVDTLSIFNLSWCSGRVLSLGYLPVMTCRKTYFRGAIVELFWILGILQAQNPIPETHRNNVKYLQREKCSYWDKWADENGDLGPVYGAQLTEWKTINGETINQIQQLIEKLRTNPDDRRLVCTMWNPGELSEMALPPCHYGFECYSKPLNDGTRELSLRWIQRSCDMPIGIPYDIIMYSILLFMLCKLTNHKIGQIHGLFGDCHIYKNQIDGVTEMLDAPLTLPPVLDYSGPEHVESLNDFKLEWFNIKDYNFYKDIKLPVTV